MALPVCATAIAHQIQTKRKNTLNTSDSYIHNEQHHTHTRSKSDSNVSKNFNNNFWTSIRKLVDTIVVPLCRRYKTKTKTNGGNKNFYTEKKNTKSETWTRNENNNYPEFKWNKKKKDYIFFLILFIWCFEHFGRVKVLWVASIRKQQQINNIFLLENIV